MDSIIVFGNVGSDAGWWVLGADGKVHHVGGWPPEAREAFASMVENFKVLQGIAGKQIEGTVEDSSPDPLPA